MNLKFLERRPWLFVFLYSLGVGILVRCVLLPYVFPQWHEGEGWLANGDWLYFHERATWMANDMAYDGLQAWSWGNNNNALIAIAAWIYYGFGHAPIFLMPINASIHTLSAYVLWRLFQRLGFSSQSAYLGILPFVFFPTAFLWLTQWHKDGFTFLGFFVYLLGFSYLLLSKTTKPSSCLLGAFCLLLGGSITLWIRPFLYHPMFIACLLMVVLSLRTFLKTSWLTQLTWVVCLGLSLSVLHQEYALALTHDAQVLEAAMSTGTYVLKEEEALRFAKTKKISPKEVTTKDILLALQKEDPEVTQETLVPKNQQEWKEKMAYLIGRVISYREGFLIKHGGSDIDTHYKITGTWSWILHTPRFLQIGLLAPFPSMWFETSKTPGGGLMRKMAALEMLIHYIALPFWILGLYTHRKNPQWWLLSLSSLALIFIYASIIPNMGALHRMRYGYLTLLTGLGIVYARSLITTLHTKGRS